MEECIKNHKKTEVFMYFNEKYFYF